MSSVSRRSRDESHSVPSRVEFEGLADEVDTTHCPNSSQDMLFINITSGTESSNPGVRQSIRRHVMKHFRRAQKVERRGRNTTPSAPPASASQRSQKRKSPRQPSPATDEPPVTGSDSSNHSSPVTADLHQLVTRSPGKSSSYTPEIEESEAQAKLIGAGLPQQQDPQEAQNSIVAWSNGQLISRYLAGNTDPFVRYPTAVSARTRRLLAHVFDENSANIKPYRDAFFALALLDAATFHQYLANFALYLPNVRSLPAAVEYEKNEALVHQDQAIRLIIKKMGSRDEVVSDGMIGAVVGMACQAHMLQDIPLWRAHMSGLKTMIRLRGGVDTLNTNPVLRKAFTWLDINSASTQDVAPHCQLPLQFIKYRPSFPPHIVPSPQVAATSAMWRDVFPEQSDAADILDEISQFLYYLQERSIQTSRRVWMDSNFAGGYLNPYIYRLLHIRSAVLPEDKRSGAVEAFRLGLLLSLGEVRRAFGIYPVISHTHVTKLRLLIETNMLEWNEFRHLGLWITTMGLLEASDQERTCFLAEWKRILKQCGLTNADEAEKVLRNLPWLDEVHGRKFRRILS